MASAGWLRGPTIGRGSTATVSLAANPSGDLFAVKSAPLSRSALLQREQSILSCLNCPSIISYLGSKITTEASGALIYNLLLEYAFAGSLADDIRRRGGRFSEDETRSIARDILCGLAHLHKSGIVHCDVKPDNVLIGSDGRAKIGDLGCARRVDEGEREIRGSPMYMAPEAVRGEEQGTSADVWSFGCTVIEMLTGRPPWPDVKNPVEAIRRIGFSGEVPLIPDCFSDLGKDFVSHCFKMNPMERWTADELLHHPFVDRSSSQTNCAALSWVSPKSVLDLSLWESVEQPQVEDEEEFLNKGRIQELFAASSDPNWTWDEDWINIRSVPEDCAAETESVSAADVAGGEIEECHFLIGDRIASTSGGAEIVFGGDDVRDGSGTCECRGRESRDRGLICVCSKIGYSFAFLIGTLLSFLKLAFCFWSF